MYMKSVSQLKNEVARKIHGRSLNRIANINSVIQEAADRMLLKIDPEGTIVTTTITPTSTKYSTTAPSDLKAKKIVDIINSSSTDITDNFRQVDYSEHIRTNEHQTFSIYTENGTKKIRITSDETPTYTVSYYSDSLFLDASDLSTRYSEIQTDENLITLDTQAYQILLYEVAWTLANDLQDDDTTNDKENYEKMLYGDGTSKNPGLYAEYGSENKSRQKKPLKYYYRSNRSKRYGW